ncbi:MAG: hypothetical protein HOV81_45500 [Kofleriaceae bacterium]|nr:hypothetical protein [Kofleriaceae bacterium]
MAEGRVSPGMKRASIYVVALLAFAAAYWYFRRPPSKKVAADAPPPPAKVVAAPEPGGESPSTPAAGPTRTVDHVTKLATPEERKRLAERIAAAQTARADAGRAATRAPAPPALPAEALESEAAPISKTAIRDAMREVIPHLTECYDAAIPDLPGNELQLVAELTLTGDPDIGTIIDAKELADKQGNKLPARFDDCLRTTFQSLALPPLAEGDTVSVHYPFLFSH